MVTFKFKGKLGEEYYDVLDWIYSNGVFYEDESGFTCIEPLESVTIMVERPIIGIPQEVLPEYTIQRLGSSFLIDYAARVAWGKPEPGDWKYSYGERIADQLDAIIQKLKKNPNTRRATATFYYPADVYLEHPPCMCALDLKIRLGKLHLFTWIRSNDMENAYPADYYALLMIAKRVSDEVGISVDLITTRSESAHIYVR